MGGAEYGRLLVISPHLDDAVFACGTLLAAHPGATVVTLFAGWPEQCERLTEWDATCGYASAREAVTGRRAEDRAALGRLRANAVWLPFPDAQYGATPDLAAVAEPLRREVEGRRPDTVLVPLGLFHSDHEFAHRAALELLGTGRKPCRWIGYEDTCYRRIPGLLQRRLAALERARITATPLACASRVESTTKRAAVECYRSQLRGMRSPGRPGIGDAFAPEGYWQLVRREGDG